MTSMCNSSWTLSLFCYFCGCHILHPESTMLGSEMTYFALMRFLLFPTFQRIQLNMCGVVHIFLLNFCIHCIFLQRIQLNRMKVVTPEPWRVKSTYFGAIRSPQCHSPLWTHISNCVCHQQFYKSHLQLYVITSGTFPYVSDVAT